MKALLLSKGTSSFICKPVSNAYGTVVDTVRLSRLGVGGWRLILSTGCVAAIPAEERDEAHCKDKGGT